MLCKNMKNVQMPRSSGAKSAATLGVRPRVTLAKADHVPKGRKHPDQAAWKAFSIGSVDSKTHSALSEHLSICTGCQKIVEETPPPPCRVFGRPALEPSLQSILIAEGYAREVLRHVGKHEETFVIAGDLKSEGLVDQVLSMVVFRMSSRRLCQVVDVFQNRYPRAIVPDSDVVVFMDATWFPERDAWRFQLGEKHVIFTGDIEAWRSAGVDPDLVVKAGSDPQTAEDFSRRFKRAALEWPPSLRAGLFSSAVGVDWPVALAGGITAYDAAESPLVTVGSGFRHIPEYLSLQSAWMARKILLEEPEIAGRLRSDMRSIDMPKPLLCWIEDRARRSGFAG
jgi:hypothetical protein